MSLQDWQPRDWSIEAEVRSILTAQNRTTLDTVACRRWAREFIQALIPGWQCGAVLTPEQARLVGKAFSELQGSAPYKPPKFRKRA